MTIEISVVVGSHMHPYRQVTGPDVQDLPLTGVVVEVAHLVVDRADGGGGARAAGVTRKLDPVAVELRACSKSDGGDSRLTGQTLLV